jgi:phospholipid/cholesterol/gamma-HCH transport system substrate-binding protein
MEPERRRTLRVGVTVTVAVLLAMAGTFLIGREQQFWERKNSYEIRFTRINGLRVGSVVSLTGVDIGSVDGVSFPENSSANYLSVTVRVSRRAALRIRGDSVARIRTIGLLGDKYIEISAGSPQAEQLPPGAIIPSSDPIDYEALLGESGDIITNIVEVTTSLRNVLSSIESGEGLLGQMVKNREQGTATLADLQKAIAHIEHTSAAFERIASGVEAGKGAFGVLLRRGHDMERLLDGLAALSNKVAELAGKIEAAEGALPRLVQDKEYGDALLRDLRAAIRNLSEVAEKINNGKGTAGSLVNDPQLYHDAKELVSSTRSSWMFNLYQGFRGLFPPYSAPAPFAPPLAADAPNATSTP